MASPSPFSHTPPPLVWIGPGRHLLTDDFSFLSPTEGLIVVEKGFDTDGASIPRVLRGVYAADGPWMPAAIPHDRMYWGQERPREVADRIFLEALTAVDSLRPPPGPSRIDRVKYATESARLAARRQLFYRSVRAFGWINWNANAKKKALEK